MFVERSAKFFCCHPCFLKFGGSNLTITTATCTVIESLGNCETWNHLLRSSLKKKLNARGQVDKIHLESTTILYLVYRKRLKSSTFIPTYHTQFVRRKIKTRTISYSYRHGYKGRQTQTIPGIVWARQKKTPTYTTWANLGIMMWIVTPSYINLEHSSRSSVLETNYLELELQITYKLLGIRVTNYLELELQITWN